MERITDMLAAGRTFSFEFFPPKDEREQTRLRQTLVDLTPLRPSFVSVTYRGGASSRSRTTAVVEDLLRTTALTPMAHLTCVAHTRFELGEIMGGFRALGCENLLALGGDPLPEGETKHELRYASELVLLGRRLGFPSIGVAAHPAGHPRSPDLASDRAYLATKIALADFAITQFFFKADEYLRLRDDVAAHGVTKPVIAGIMPITSLASVQRMAELSGYAVPDDVVKRITAGGETHDAVRERGIELAAAVVRDMTKICQGVHIMAIGGEAEVPEILRQSGVRS